MAQREEGGAGGWEREQGGRGLAGVVAGGCRSLCLLAIKLPEKKQKEGCSSGFPCRVVWWGSPA